MEILKWVLVWYMVIQIVGHIILIDKPRLEITRWDAVLETGILSIFIWYILNS